MQVAVIRVSTHHQSSRCEGASLKQKAKVEQTHSLLQFIRNNDPKSRVRALGRQNKAAITKRSCLNRPQPLHPGIVQIDRGSGRNL